MLFGADVVARKELLACLIAICCFRCRISDRIMDLFSDNTSAVNWLKKGRSSNMLGNGYLAYWELQKLRAQCKISPKWIPGAKNVTADTLSKGWYTRMASSKRSSAGMQLERSRLWNPPSCAWNKNMYFFLFST